MECKIRETHVNQYAFHEFIKIAWVLLIPVVGIGFACVKLEKYEELFWTLFIAVPVILSFFWFKRDLIRSYRWTGQDHQVTFELRYEEMIMLVGLVARFVSLRNETRHGKMEFQSIDYKDVKSFEILGSVIVIKAASFNGMNNNGMIKIPVEIDQFEEVKYLLSKRIQVPSKNEFTEG